MEQDGLYIAVVAAHDAEALGEGGAVIARGHAFVEVVDEREARVMQHGALLHHADTPVEVSGEAVAEVRRSGSGGHRARHGRGGRRKPGGRRASLGGNCAM